MSCHIVSCDFTTALGVHEAYDDSLKVTAVRELFEETGILLSNELDGKVISSAEVLKGREILKSEPQAFGSVYLELDRTPRMDLVHFCTFITPPFETRQYETHFFLSEVRDDECAAMLADGNETASLIWLDPIEALERQERGDISFLPPQYYILSEISQFKRSDLLFGSLRSDNANGIDSRGYPEMRPSIIEGANTAGTIALALPYDEDHCDWPGLAGQMHRMICGLPMGKGRYRIEKRGLDNI